MTPNCISVRPAINLTPKSALKRSSAPIKNDGINKRDGLYPTKGRTICGIINPTKPIAPDTATQDPTANDDFTTKPTTKPSETEQPTDCVHATTVVKGLKLATYFAKGYTGDKVCSICSGLIEQGKQTAKLKLNKPKFSAKRSGKNIKVTYRKVKGANRFQVRYRIKGKWKIKIFKAGNKKKVVKLIRKLKKGTYKVQVRAMVIKGKLKAYSKWASAKKVKIK